MRKLFCVLAVLFTLTAFGQHSEDELVVAYQGDYTATVDSLEYYDAMKLADEIFTYQLDERSYEYFDIFVDIHYERIDNLLTGEVVYVKQILEEFYGY
jgi:hypothetical protein